MKKREEDEKKCARAKMTHILNRKKEYNIKNNERTYVKESKKSKIKDGTYKLLVEGGMIQVKGRAEQK